MLESPANQGSRHELAGILFPSPAASAASDQPTAGSPPDPTWTELGWTRWTWRRSEGTWQRTGKPRSRRKSCRKWTSAVISSPDRFQLRATNVRRISPTSSYSTLYASPTLPSWTNAGLSTSSKSTSISISTISPVGSSGELSTLQHAQPSYTLPSHNSDIHARFTTSAWPSTKQPSNDASHIMAQ